MPGHGDEGTAHRSVTALACPFVQFVAGALVIVAGTALGVTGWLGWRGALPRNRFVGVRTPVTMASDEAFQVGNRVAGPVLVAAGAIAVLGGLAALVAASRSADSPSDASPSALVVVLGVVTTGVLGLALAGGVLGSRAAAAIAPSPPGPCADCTCGGHGGPRAG